MKARASGIVAGVLVLASAGLRQEGGQRAGATAAGQRPRDDSLE